MAHRIFLLFLFFIGITSIVAIGVRGCDYYITPVAQRAFMNDHRLLKPSGLLSHGLGVVGAAMITLGVITYSTRKRVRTLWNIGKLSSWLEFHIFLCLLGPVLVVYHSTFKAGGIAAISLWAMLSVAGSGIIGRFLYVLIPRNIKGGELTADQINAQFDLQEKALRETEFGSDIVKYIDKSFADMKRPKNFLETVSAFIRLYKLKRNVRALVRSKISKRHIDHTSAANLVRITSARTTLIQKSILLLQVEKLFYYWHAIHLPFTAIMFVTLALHVGVAIWLGYTWIF
jgi:hypothetical protein